MNIYIKMLASLFAVLSLLSCENQELEFDDFEEQTIYFPNKFPIRTLILGEDRYDNSIDQEHAFTIAANIGGTYNNKEDRVIDFTIDNSLLDTMKLDDSYGTELRALPSIYYTVTPGDKITIPAGSFDGRIRIQLNDNFFQDDSAHLVKYCVPVILGESTSGKVLSGTKQDWVENPIPTVDGDWAEKPQNYTLFFVNYINEWHGRFFHRGVQYRNDTVDQRFHERDLVRNQNSFLKTNAYRSVLCDRVGQFTKAAGLIQLNFGEPGADGSGLVQVVAPDSSTLTISGGGTYYQSQTDFAKQHGSWLVLPDGSVQSHLTIVLDYTVEGGLDSGNPTDNFRLVDTLVYQSNMVGVEFAKVAVKD